MKKFLHRYKGALILAFAASFMVFICEQIISYSSNVQDFWYDIYLLFPILIFEFLLSFAFISAVFILLKKYKKKLYRVFYMLAVALYVALYIEGNFLVGFLPGLNGDTIIWKEYIGQMILSTLVWIAIFVVAIILFKKLKFKKFEKYSIYAMAIISVLLFSSCIFQLFTTDALVEKNSIATTEDNINDISNKENFIIFVVDTVDAVRFHNELKKLGKEEIFNDFTFFKDTMSIYPNTKFSVPQILTGMEFKNETSFKDYCIKAYDESPLFKELEKRDYTMNLYNIDFPYQGENYKRFANVYKEDHINFIELLKNQLRLVAFKYFPYPVKKFTHIEYLNFRLSRKPTNGKKLFEYGNYYHFYRWQEEDVNVVDHNNFIYLHLEGAHSPYDTDYDMNVYPGHSSNYTNKVGSTIRVMEEYLKRVKDSGYYDNSVIIFMSDHGYGGPTHKGRQNAVLLVKGIDEHHKFTVSDTKVSFDELQDAYLDLLKKKKSTEIFPVSKEERRLLYYVYLKDCDVTEQKTTGHAWETNLLKDTGVKYDCK